MSLKVHFPMTPSPVRPTVSKKKTKKRNFSESFLSDDSIPPLPSPVQPPILKKRTKIRNFSESSLSDDSIPPLSSPVQPTVTKKINLSESSLSNNPINPSPPKKTPEISDALQLPPPNQIIDNIISLDNDPKLKQEPSLENNIKLGSSVFYVYCVLAHLFILYKLFLDVRNISVSRLQNHVAVIR